MESFDRSALVRCSRGSLFGADAPRLPAQPLLAFDRVAAISLEGGAFGQGFARASRRVQPLDEILAAHFVGDPVVPGSLLIEGLLQLTGFCGAFAGLTGRGRAASVEGLSFLSEITLADREIDYEIEVRKISAGRQTVIAEGLVRSGRRECLRAERVWVVMVPPSIR